MEKNLSMSFFMREELKEDEIVEIPGLEMFKDDEGNIIPFKVKVLGVEDVNKIRKAYTTKKIATDDKNKRVFDKAGKPVIIESIDNQKANLRLIVDSLIFPDLRDKQLMDFYGVHDVIDMPFKLFKGTKEFTYVSDAIAEIVGFGEDEDIEDDELVEEAKN